MAKTLKSEIAFANAAWPLSVNLTRYDALFFDLDGTLVDTMSAHGMAYGLVFEELGYQFTLEDYFSNVGPPARVAIPAFAVAAGMGRIDQEKTSLIHSRKKEKFKEILGRGQVATLPAAQLLERCMGVKYMALVSSGNRDGVTAILRAMNWDAVFNIIVTGDDVSVGKPQPEAYLKALAGSGVDPRKCLVFEDTEIGAQSAIAAGLDVVDVTAPGKGVTSGLA